MLSMQEAAQKWREHFDIAINDIVETTEQLKRDIAAQCGLDWNSDGSEDEGCD
jgi:hypothetical protein